MEALPRVGVFEKMGAVEVRQAVRVRREVRRHPVEQHSNIVLVQVVHQVHEILRSSITRCRREIAAGLITPRTIERMFHDGEELHVSEAHFLHILGQTRSGIAIA